MPKGHPAVSAEKIAKRLRQILKAAGIKQAEFARRIGESPQKVNNWFTGAHVPSVDGVLNIEDAFGYRSRWLIFGEEPEKRIEPRHKELVAALDALPSDAIPAVQELLKVLQSRRSSLS